MRFTFQAGKAFPVLALALAVASHANAQGLGDITLESALHEPLRAHIDLIDIGNLDVSQIKVALASQQEFQSAGIDRSAELNRLKFTVEVGKDGTGRIDVRSDGDINEPFVDFLLGVTWPKGRTLREYTLLLDLPENRKSAGVANAPTVSREQQVPAGQSASRQQSPQYEVKTGDTLYQIAEQTRPSGNVGVQQMMIAIQRANEDAFVNNNVNRILVGKVLRIPRMEEIRLIDQEAAVAQVNQQNVALNSETLTVNNSAGAPKAAPRDELTLLSGDQDGKVGGSNDLDATIKQLENQMMVSEEGLDRARLENLELTNRLAAVQEQIDLLQNIIAIEDERIAQMQTQLGKQTAATKDALAKVEASAAAGDGADDSSGLIALLSNSVVLLGAVLAAALGVAGMLFVRRRNAQAALEAEGVGLEEEAAIADTNDAAPTGGLRAMLDTLLARFRRREPEHEDIEDQFTFSEAAVASSAVVAEQAEHPLAAPAVQQPTDKLLDEMGLIDDFMDLQDSPDESEAIPTEVDAQASAGVVDQELPPADAAIAEAGAMMEEAKLLDQALDEADQLPEMAEDFLQAAPQAQPESVATTPETFAFTTEPVEEATPAAAEAATDDKPEVFEFTLPNLEETPAASAAPADSIGAEHKLETIRFDGFTPSLGDEAIADLETAADDDALEVLSFDEDSVKPEDDESEGDGYSGDGTQDTHDARLDLAVAYEAMGDLDGAVEILEEVIGNGRPTQVEEAKRLKQKWQNA